MARLFKIQSNSPVGSISRIIFYALLTGFIISCDKKDVEPEPTKKTTPIQNGLPEDRKKINGYFYAGVSSYNNGFTTFDQLNAFAVFGEPGSNLMSNYDHTYDRKINDLNGINGGNINVGEVRFAEKALSINSNSIALNNVMYSYRLDGAPGTVTPTPKWTITGNGSFVPINITVNRGFPRIIDPPSNYSLYISKGFTMELSNFIENFDSLIVLISNSTGTNTSNFVRKVVLTGENQLVITTAELSPVSKMTFGYISFIAYNYSNKIVEDKRYVFELAKKVENRSIKIYP